MRGLRFVRSACAALAACGIAGCVNLAPVHVRPAAPVAAQWPGSAASAAGGPAAADIDWRSFVTDSRLRDVIERALQNNRDLRVAVLNIERARAQYRIERSALLPEIGVGAGASRQRTPATTSASGVASTSTQYSVALGLAAYELDFFGRVRNLGDTALESFSPRSRACG
jgi:outer membrane protein, multidrug efflux system